MRAAGVGAAIILLSLLVLGLAGVAVHARMIPRTARHYAGELPSGYNVSLFLHICQICGQFYGMDHSSSCVHDKTFRTFVLCLSSVSNR